MSAAAIEDRKHDLPAAWVMALSTCPYCSGTGERGTDLEPNSCAFCGDSGDLFGHIIEAVYTMGRDETLLTMRALYIELVKAGTRVADHNPPAEQLKARLGL